MKASSPQRRVIYEQGSPQPISALTLKCPRLPKVAKVDWAWQRIVDDNRRHRRAAQALRL